MKKLLAGCLMVLLAASTSWALTYTTSKGTYDVFVNTPTGWTYSGADTILGYSLYSPNNPDDELGFANVVLNAYGYDLTKLLYFDYAMTKPAKFDLTVTPDDFYNPGFDPKFSWEYAVVKVDGINDYSYLFKDTTMDDILQTFPAGAFPFNDGDKGPYGISHITFFDGDGGVVPEPSTVLLLGSGLIGLALYGRKRKKE